VDPIKYVAQRPPTSLQGVAGYLDAELRKIQRAIELLVDAVGTHPRIQQSSWTPAIRGSSSAGVYETVSASGQFTRIGARVFADFQIVMAASLTGGGTGYLQITGLPFAKAGGTAPIGPVLLSGVDWTAGANQTLNFISASTTSTLYIAESRDFDTPRDLSIGDLTANDIIMGSINYITEDEFL
jgi:hypothetical protein